MDVNRCLDDFDPDFKYTYANVSHSWITNYPERLRPDPNSLQISCMKEAFQEPVLHIPSTKGKRKKLLEEFFRKIISEEELNAFDSEKIVIEEYETDYTEHFKNPDDMLLPGEVCSKNEKLKLQGVLQTDELKKSKMEELKSKYPLYFSSPLSFFRQTTGRETFGRSTTITKRPEDNYDNIEY